MTDAKMTRRRALQSAAALAATLLVPAGLGALAESSGPQPVEPTDEPTGVADSDDYPFRVESPDDRFTIYECEATKSIDALVMSQLPNSELGRRMRDLISTAVWIYQDSLESGVIGTGCCLAMANGWESHSETLDEGIVNTWPSLGDWQRAMSLEQPVWMTLFDYFFHDLNMIPPRLLMQMAGDGYIETAFDRLRGRRT